MFIQVFTINTIDATLWWILCKHSRCIVRQVNLVTYASYCSLTKNLFEFWKSYFRMSSCFDSWSNSQCFWIYINFSVTFTLYVQRDFLLYSSIICFGTRDVGCGFDPLVYTVVRTYRSGCTICKSTLECIWYTPYMLLTEFSSGKNYWFM